MLATLASGRLKAEYTPLRVIGRTSASKCSLRLCVKLKGYRREESFPDEIGLFKGMHARYGLPQVKKVYFGGGNGTAQREQ